MILSWTALVAVAVLAALAAWQQPEPVYAAVAPERPALPDAPFDARPEPLPTLAVPPPPPPPVGESPSPRALTVELRVAPGAAAGLEGFRVAALVGEPPQIVADAPCAAGATPGTAVARLAELPPTRLRIVACAPEDGPRHGYRAIATVDLGGPTPPLELALDVPTRPLEVRLTWAPCDDDPAYRNAVWLPITARLVAVDDPGWAQKLERPVRAALAVGEITLAFTPVPPGRYRLECEGFELDDASPFASVDGGTIERRGRPVPPETGSLGPGPGAAPTAPTPDERPGPTPRRDG